MISHLFKVPKHRSFNYKPRHYDINTEAMEDVRKANQAAQSDSKESNFNSKRISFKQMQINNHYAEQKETRVRYLIRFGTVILLVAVLYLLFDVSSQMF